MLFRSREEVRQQALFAGAMVLGDQFPPVLLVLIVLVPAPAANVAGDQLVVEVDTDPVGPRFDRQFAVSIGAGDGVTIGIQPDPKLTGGDAREGTRAVIGVRVEGLEMRAFLNKQIAGPLSRFVVDAHVGDGVEPESCRGLNGGEFRQFQAPEEILLDVADSRFDAPLLVGAADIAGRNLEAIMTGKIDIPRIEDRCGADQTLQDCRFEIIDHNLARHASERCEGVLVEGEEILHRLGDGELHIHLPAISQHHHKEREPALGVVDSDGPVGAPVHLSAFARGERQLQIDWQLRRTDASDVITQDGDAALISLFTQALENLLRTIGVGVEEPGDGRLEGVEQALPRPAAPRREVGARHPGRDRAWVETEEPRGLGDRQALAIVAIVDFTERFVIDHDRPPPPDSTWDSPRDPDIAREATSACEPEAARISLPRRNKRPAATAMSSCNSPPAI